MKRTIRTVVVVAVAGCLVMAGYWAGSESLTPPSTPRTEAVTTALRVTEGEVGRSMRISVTAERKAGRAIRAGRSGVITAVGDQATVGEGDVLMAINLRPMVVILGQVPSFRDLTLGDSGPDVAQLQSFLASQDGTVKVTGTFDAATVAAVQQWQRRLGIEPSGVVALTDVAFLPVLPQRVDVPLVVGDQVDASTVVAREVSSELQFSASLPSDPSFEVGAQVSVDLPSGPWVGSVTAIDPSDPGSVTLEFSPRPGEHCGPCAEIEGAGPYIYSGSLTVVPSTVGPLVPIGSVSTDGVGRHSVIMDGGEVRLVTIKIAYGGLAVVDGVEEGESILLPAQP